MFEVKLKLSIFADANPAGYLKLSVYKICIKAVRQALIKAYYQQSDATKI